MSVTLKPRYRVVCAEHTVTRTTLGAAERLADQLNHKPEAGGCLNWHQVQILADGEWVARHVLQAREILAAPAGQRFELPDGALVKAEGGWSAETAAKLGDLPDTATVAQVRGILGRHEWATLTTDGRMAGASWCGCSGVDFREWVRYERYTAEGRTAHGYVHADIRCRAVLQSG